MVFNVINNAIAVTQYSGVDPDYERQMVAKFEPLLSEYTNRLDLLLADANYIGEVAREEHLEIDGTTIDLSTIDAKAIGFIGINELNEGHIVISNETGENINLDDVKGSIQELSITQTSNILDPTDENIKINSENLPKELELSIRDAVKNGVISRNKSGAYVLIQVTIGEGINKKTVYIIKEADTIVYINSTKPGVVIKEILRRILINRPNASELAVNRMFLLIIIIGLICVGFGIGLAIYITKLQLQKTNYFPATIKAGKSFQPNLVPSWKQR